MPIELLDISISGKQKRIKPEPKFKSRRYEDGSIDIQLSKGRVIRQKPSLCSVCGRGKFDIPYGRNNQIAAMNGICVECYEVEAAERQETIEAERLERLQRGDTSGKRRWSALVLATPLWRDREKIKEIYEKAAILTQMTGIKHEVDHVFPIQSQYACGLHVHQNLQILDKFQNRSKSNSFPMFDSPCGVGVE